MRLLAALLTLLLAAIALAPAALAQTTWHVDADAPPGGDGLAWQTAFDDLQPAMELAMPGDSIWLAEGVYVPSVRPPNAVTFDFYFEMPDGVAILGGFNGTGTDESQRDPEQFESVISGDLDGDDLDTPVTGSPYLLPEMADLLDSIENNTGTLLFVDRTGPGTRLDGLVLEGAYTYDAHGSKGPASRNGVFVLGAHLEIHRCVFRRNITGAPGALYIAGCGDPPYNEWLDWAEHPCVPSLDEPIRSVVTITESAFRNNYQRFYSGAPIVYSTITAIHTDLTIADTEFSFNLDPRFQIDRFFGERVAQNGLLIEEGSDATIERCTFTRCGGYRQGAQQDYAAIALGVVPSDPPPNAVISDCVFRDNLAGMTGVINLLHAGAVRIERNRFEGSLWASPQVAGGIASGISLSSAIQNPSDVLIAHNTFAGTVAIDPETGDLPDAEVSIIGGSARDARIHSNTLAGYNRAAALIDVWRGDLIANLEIHDAALAASSFIRPPSDGGDGWGDDPNTPDTDESLNDDFGDLRLRPGSPAIDRADAATVDPAATDLAGNPRVADDTGVPDRPGTLDLGAYEFQGTSCLADVNRDGDVNPSDFFAWVTFFVADPRPPEQDALCDVNRDDSCTSSDFFAWVTLFTGPSCE